MPTNLQHDNTALICAMATEKLVSLTPHSALQASASVKQEDDSSKRSPTQIKMELDPLMVEELFLLRELLKEEAVAHLRKCEKMRQKIKSISEERDFLRVKVDCLKIRLQIDLEKLNMMIVMKEYEKTITQLKAENEVLLQSHKSKVQAVKKETDRISDISGAFEKGYDCATQNCKFTETIIKELETKKATLSKALKDYQERISDMNEKCTFLKNDSLHKLRSIKEQTDILKKHQLEVQKWEDLVFEGIVQTDSCEQPAEENH